MTAKPREQARCLDAAIAAGVDYLRLDLTEIDPNSLTVLDYLHRRFASRALAGARPEALPAC